MQKNHQESQAEASTYSQPNSFSKMQGLHQSKKFLWRSVSYYFHKHASENSQKPVFNNYEDYSVNFEDFLQHWEGSMNKIYEDLHIMDRTHLVEITKNAVEFIEESPMFQGKAVSAHNGLKHDVANQMAIYYFFKKKLEWVNRMELIQQNAKDHTHNIVGHVGMARQRG